MTGKRWLVALAVVAIGLGLGYTALKVYRGSQPESCYACQRPIHQHSRTVAFVNGRPKIFCCPACALSEHAQEGKPIRVTELTSFLTGAKLPANEAFVVKGSNVNMCVTTDWVIGAEKQPAHVTYDRCAPSLIAFGQQSEALEFAMEHGGQVFPFSEIVTAFAH